MGNHRKIFLKSFLSSPRSIGSIVPSSQYLVKSMAAIAEIRRDSKVVELGAGTGVLTKSILEGWKSLNPLIVFERDIDLQLLLKNQFQNLCLYEDATRLHASLNYEENVVDFIFSGLPLFNFERERLTDLFKQINTVLKPTGKFITFQYTLFLLPVFKENFTNIKVKYVFLNFPPAFIVVCEKKIKYLVKIFFK